jgi:DNA-binding NarL/FixJ family response regulator
LEKLVDEGQLQILLADSHSLFREAIRSVLSLESDLRVVADASTADEAVSLAEELQPDVALVDGRLTGCDGASTTARIKRSVPHCNVLVLSGLEHDDGLLVRVVEAGASGFLMKESPLSDLIEATRAIGRGDTVIPQGLLGSLLDHLVGRRRRQDEAMHHISRLTPREREVLSYLADGADNSIIAQELFISPETVRTHVQKILGKLNVHSRLEAAAFVIYNGLQTHLVPIRITAEVGSV